MAEVCEGLSVDAQRMRDNLDATRGVIFAERAMMMLGPKLGRDVAHKVLEEATRKAAIQGRHLAEVLAEMPEVTRHLDRAALSRIEAPEEYLGAAETFRKNLLAFSRQATKKEQ
jgi:3-carboxy-cis,cis-muconate cycloisomerase